MIATQNGLTLDLETLAELTPEAARQVNGGLAVSSAMPQPQGGVSSALPPVHHTKKKHHHHDNHAVSSARPF